MFRDNDHFSNVSDNDQNELIVNTDEYVKTEVAETEIQEYVKKPLKKKKMYLKYICLFLFVTVIVSVFGMSTFGQSGDPKVEEPSILILSSDEDVYTLVEGEQLPSKPLIFIDEEKSTADKVQAVKDNGKIVIDYKDIDIIRTENDNYLKAGTYTAKIIVGETEYPFTLTIKAKDNVDSTEVNGDKDATINDERNSSSSSNSTSSSSSTTASGNANSSSDSTASTKPNTNGNTSNNNNTSTTKPSSGSTNSSSSGNDSSNSTTTKPSTNSGSSGSENTNTSTPVHTHEWVAVTETIYHEATINKILLEDGWWDYDVYTCKGCYNVFSYDGIMAHTEEQMLAGNIACGDFVDADPIYHEPKYKEEIQDAWTETKVVGYKCDCGATKWS